ncbi:MAG: hypothetical protein ACI9UN_000277 [Granulosicoccus sp.]|jgi:hypothetical protein
MSKIDTDSSIKAILLGDENKNQGSLPIAENAWRAVSSNREPDSD